MHIYNKKYIVDSNGDIVEVVLPIGDYDRLLEEIEELESIKQYDLAKSRDEELIPFDLAMAEIGT